MADKYIALLNGVEHEVEGNVVGGTSVSGGKIVALDGNGRLDASIMPNGIGADVFVGPAAEALTIGNPLVYIKSDGTVARASAGVGGNPAIGYITAAAGLGEDVTVYFDGKLSGLSGLTIGARCYLSDVTPGAVTQTPVTGAGKLHQFVGRALSASLISFEEDDHIVRA